MRHSRDVHAGTAAAHSAARRAGTVAKASAVAAVHVSGIASTRAAIARSAVRPIDTPAPASDASVIRAVRQREHERIGFQRAEACPKQ
eukprot:scaffold5417_cov129-Isochrysis_galbana.AAC.5